MYLVVVIYNQKEEGHLSNQKGRLMKIVKDIYNSNLTSPEAIRVVTVDNDRKVNKLFPMSSDMSCVGEFIKSVWNNCFFPDTVYVYYVYGLDDGEPLYCTYKVQ